VNVSPMRGRTTASRTTSASVAPAMAAAGSMPPITAEGGGGAEAGARAPPGTLQILRAAGPGRRLGRRAPGGGAIWDRCPTEVGRARSAARCADPTRDAACARGTTAHRARAGSDKPLSGDGRLVERACHRRLGTLLIIFVFRPSSQSGAYYV
jgi:hypothetical protein